jgi:hypothetical protein
VLATQPPSDSVITTMFATFGGFVPTVGFAFSLDNAEDNTEDNAEDAAPYVLAASGLAAALSWGGLAYDLYNGG